MKFKAAIFDLDGTLLDTLEDLADSLNRALAATGFPVHPIAAYRTFVGDGARTLVTRALPEEERNPQTVEALLISFMEEYGRGWDQKTRPYPGIPEVLDELIQKKIPLAVLSNKPQAFTEKCVFTFFDKDVFKLVLGDRKGIPKKPDPGGALEIAESLGIWPDQTAFIGDSNVDMETARAAQMTPVGVLWGFRGQEELTRHGAKILAQTPNDLTGLF